MTAILFRIALILAVGVSAEAYAVRSDWAEADEAKMRVLLAGPREEGIAGGIEILLEPGWYTYWRNPGEAGVPPTFDFSGSDNVQSVEVLYPAPSRYDDGTSVSLVYHDEVVFPLIIRPIDPNEPVILHADAAFGVCSKVCIPTRASAVATLPREAPYDALTEARLKRFEARVPRAAEPGRFEVEAVVAAGDALHIEVRMPDSSYSDLFADPPNGWYLGQPVFTSRAQGVSRYRLSLAGKPEGATAIGTTFRFVAIASGDAIEQEIEVR